MDTLVWISQQSASGIPVALARIVAVSGFGGKRSGELMGVSNTESIGQLALGAADDATRSAAIELLSSSSSKNAVSTAMLTVPVGDSEAVAAGLACGGSAVVLIEVAANLPPLFWTASSAGRSVVLASGPTGAIAVTSGEVEGSLGLETSDGVANFDDEVVVMARRMLAKGPIDAVTSAGDAKIFLTLLAPQPRLLVFGEAQLATALVAQGNLVGWKVEVRSDQGSSVNEAIAMAGEAGPLDGVVVLSHDVPSSCRVLEAALRSTCGYVGALGSRHTQSARDDYLASALGIGSEDRSRVHGPVGLNIGSRTPEETALAIVAEMIAARSLTKE